jgi:hypothetical protein
MSRPKRSATASIAHGVKTYGFSEAVGSGINLGRERTLAGCQQILVLRLGSSSGARAGSGAP